MLDRARDILKRVFGFEDFIHQQEKVLRNLLEGRDTLAVMPTGGGKSICYQIPALLWDGVTVVVSPLISLMKDQVDQLHTLGVPAVMLNSTLSDKEYRAHVTLMRNGAVALAYMAPETVLRPAVLELLASCRVPLLAIDEAHCISEWGSDFRPEYRRLAQLRTRLSNAVCLALTATATPRVRRDIQECLRMTSPAEVVASFNRENLFLRVEEKVNPLRQLLSVIERYSKDAGIVYCQTRDGVDKLCRVLQAKGIKATAYHAGLEDEERRRAQELFVRDHIQVMVATVAFGMGIDKSNVRYVVHYDLPKSLEGYYQEIGRSGRDGLRAECVLLYSYGDVIRTQRLIKHHMDPPLRSPAQARLQAMVQFAETPACRRVPLLAYFGEEYGSDPCGMCDNCTAPERPLADLTIPAQKLLSCVARTGQRFGVHYVVSVLCGSESTKVISRGHHQVSTYGIGTELSRRGWLSLARCLRWHGFLEQDEEFGSVRLTEKARTVLRSREPILLRWQPPEEKASDGASEICEENPVWFWKIFERLRQKRLELARDLSVPPYVIFHDKTLSRMAVQLPETPQEFLNIPGVGEGKLQRFGEDFLKVIREFRREHPEVEPWRSSSRASSSAKVSREKRHQAVGQAFNEGKSLKELCREYDVQRSTIVEHLRRYQEEGHVLREDGLISELTLPVDLQNRVKEAFERLGAEFLKPVWEALEGRVDYDHLHLLRLFYMNQWYRSAGVRCSQEETVCQVDLICLANSRKYSGRCIAGKEWNGRKPGRWVRPVGPGPRGELSVEDLRLTDGSFPRLLDVVRVSVGAARGPDHQPENVAMEPGALQRVGRYPFEKAESLCDPVSTLWINGHNSFGGLNDRMTLEEAKRADPASLLFIEPQNLVLRVAPNTKGLNKVWAQFTFGGIPYRLSVTDPVVEQACLRRTPGEYPVSARAFLTVSLSEVFEGHVYKLAAALVWPGAGLGETT